MQKLRYFEVFLTVPLFFFSSVFFSSIAFAQFSDIHKDSLTYLYRHQVINGYADGTFRPQEKMRRAEFVKLALDANHIQVANEKNCFSDIVSGSWYEPYVCTAKKLGYIDNAGDHTFRPQAFITKVDALKILGAIGDWDLVTDEPLTDGFHDISKNSWYFPYVRAAKLAGYIDPVAYFHPLHFITREEAAEIIFRITLGKKMGVDLENNLALLARDFFRIEAAAMTKTYADFEAFKNKSTPVKTSPIGNEILQPQTMLTDQEGNTYAIFHLYVLGPMPDHMLEYEAKTSSHMSTLLMAKFNPSKKLVAFDWYNFVSGPTTGYYFRLLKASGKNFTLDLWETGANGFMGPEKTQDFVVENIR